ncbi:MAG: GTP diphosphokinase [Succinivibrionaceae bacterium]
MVAVRTTHVKDNFDLENWIQHLPLNLDEIEEIRKVFVFCHNQMKESEFDKMRLANRAAEIIGILLTLHMDLASFKVAILYPHIEENYFTIDEASKYFGKDIAFLLHGVKDMEAMRFIQNLSTTGSINDSQVDTVRRMLLAMVEDVRAVIIKLSERIATLREVKNSTEETRVLIAKEISNIYAPLANRLGIGQLKWELEDLSFRYLHPDIYKQIAKLLDEKRIDREIYINEFVSDLRKRLQDENINADVYGRPKHIYSIWRKMQKKNLDFSDLYDVRAVRVIVERLQDCYAALGVIHTQYHHIPREFDDYIANPKPNGYKSIHTVVLGPQGKTVEIQIRTQQMHKDAELGVAAHWKYKEGKNPNLDAAYEERIAWLRKLLAWQEDMVESGAIIEEFKTQVFEERVYVFTPKGDVVDLPVGATPLDFAYHIHSMVGHRCIGAKVDGKIVPFTYMLQTGDQVELITQKEPNPSRDWLNPNNGFLKTSKARAKVASWFKKIDKEKNIIAGKEMLEKEIERHGLMISKDKLPSLVKDILRRFNSKDHYDLFAGIGSGDVHLNQIINYLEEKVSNVNNKTDSSEELIKTIELRTANRIANNRTSVQKNQIDINGVGNLMTHISKCCHPIPGDEIIGFITQGRGISIHRTDCITAKNLSKLCPERLIEAKWSSKYSSGFTITIGIEANDRSGLLRDITTVIANEKINVLAVRSRSNVAKQLANIDIDMEVFNVNDLSKILTKLNQLNDVIYAKRL